MTNRQRILSLPLFAFGAVLAWVVIDIGQYEWNKNVSAQTQLSVIGNQASTPHQNGSPVGVWSCGVGEATAGVIDIDTASTNTTGRFWVCMFVGGTPTWANQTPPVTYYLSGVAQSAARCDIEVGTSASNGTWSVNYSSMGFSTMFTVQPSVQGTGNVPYTIQYNTASTTAATGFVSGGSLISIVGINIISLGGVAAPFTVLVCGI